MKTFYRSRFLSEAGHSLPRKKTDVLVGICSSHKYAGRRDGVRRTWLTRPTEGVECVFFAGEGNLAAEESDLVGLDVCDSYNYLPAKVFAFMRYALDHYDFQWLFKCDDDTYLDQERLLRLTTLDADFVGDISLARRGSPSGGAGYLVSRDFVRRLVSGPSVPERGAEDVIVGEKLVQLGARTLATERLRMHRNIYPRHDNQVISAHWCSSRHMEVIHAIRYSQPMHVFDAVHESWKDSLMFYENGAFCQKEGMSPGWWKVDERGDLHLDWVHYKAEVLQWDGGGYENGCLYLSTDSCQLVSRCCPV